MGAALVVHWSVSSQQHFVAAHPTFPSVKEAASSLWRLHAKAAQGSPVRYTFKSSPLWVPVLAGVNKAAEFFSPP